MRDSTPVSVRSTVTAYFDVAPTLVKPEQQLRNHWGLGPLELKRLASRIGQVERVGIRSQDLEGVHTIGHLISLVRRLRNPVPTGTFRFQPA